MQVKKIKHLHFCYFYTSKNAIFLKKYTKLTKVTIKEYDKVKLLYDKIVSDYQCILFITHNSVYKEWANSIISVTKEKNISKISQNIKQVNIY